MVLMIITSIKIQIDPVIDKTKTVAVIMHTRIILRDTYLERKCTQTLMLVKKLYD